MKITIVGAGNSGLAMAGHLAINGEEVVLWNRSEPTIAKMAETGIINIQGLINQQARIKLSTTSVEKAFLDTELVLVTTPANAHKDLAHAFAPYVKSEVPIILNPGRTFGAIEFANTLFECGVKKIPPIAETQTIMYTCRKIKEDTVAILSLKNDVLLASLNESNRYIIEQLPEAIRGYFSPADNMVQTSLGNVGMILHCTPTLLNIGWIESPNHSFKYYYDGITNTLSSLLERIDLERVAVSDSLGWKVETTAEWMRRSYGISGTTLYDCIHNNESYKTIDAPSSLNHRYIFEDVPCGLVPLESTGKKFGVDVSLCSLIIDIASNIMRTDFRKLGRNLQNLGFENKSASDIRKLLGVI